MLMHGEKFGIYSNMHRACYEKQRRRTMSPEERESFLESRRAKRNDYKRKARLVEKLSSSTKPLSKYEQKILSQIERDRAKRLAKEIRNAGTGTTQEGN